MIIKRAKRLKARGVVSRPSIVTVPSDTIILIKKPNKIIPINIIKKKVKNEIMIKVLLEE